VPRNVEDCPFCEIAAAEDPSAREVFRNERVVAFFPLEPATLGHTLVIPRRHVPDIWSLDDPLTGALAKATVRVSRAVRHAIEPEGLNVVQSNGEVATQTVFHLHVHVVPRFSNDSLGPIWPPETAYSESQKDAAWDRIRQAFQDVC
jgi:histidine triad (HIT) family protein